MVLPPRLLSGTVISALGRVVGTAVAILTVSIVSRSLTAREGVSAYGAYAAVFAFLAAAAALADGGLYLVFTRLAAPLDERREALLLRKVLLLRLLTLGAVLAVVVLVAFLAHYPLDVQRGILIGSVGTAAQLLTQPTLGVFQKRIRMLAPAISDIAGRAVTLALAAVVAWRGGTVLAFVSAYVGGMCVTLAGNLLAIRRLVPFSAGSPSIGGGTGTTATDALRLRAILREAWPLGLMIVCWFVVFRVDSLLLSYLRPPQDLGWYSLPYKVLESLLFFPAMIGGLLLPVFTRSAVAVERARAALSEATTLYLVLGIPLVVLLVLAAPWTMQVLGGPAFAPSVPVMQVLSLALGALFFGNLYGNGAVALGAQRVMLGIALALACLNVGVNLYVIPRYSFMGAAWTTLGTEVLSALAAGFVVARRTGRFLPASAHWHVLSAGGVLVMAALLPLPLAARLGVGLLLYFGALWVLGVLTPQGVRELLRSQRERGPNHSSDRHVWA